MNRIKMLRFTALALLIAGCTAISFSNESAEELKSVPQPVILSSIEHSTGDGITELVIRANIPFEYTTYDPDPEVLIIEVPEGNTESLPESLTLDTAEVKDIRVRMIAGTQGDFFIGRLEITCNPDTHHTLFMDGNELHVRVEGGGSSRTEAMVADSIPIEQPVGEQAAEIRYASKINMINIDDKDSSYTEIWIKGDGKLQYDTFEVEDPDRVVVDFQNVSMLLPSKEYEVQGPFIERVRASQYKRSPQKVARVVFDLKQDSPYEVAQSGNAIKVRFCKAPEPTLIAGAEQKTAPEPAQEIWKAEESPAKSVETEQAAEPEWKEAQPEQPLVAAEVHPEETSAITQRVAEPVEALPAQMEKQPVEDAMPGKAARDIEKMVDKKAGEDYVIFREAPEKLATVSEEEKKPMLQFETVKVTPEAVKYTGKKISLNLVDADIKQVFRLFHEISGLNFVLDPAVGGKVTIVLDNVPWDQALDIILKNNGMDKIFEDNVIRIAPTQRLAQEAASRKQLKDAKELEADPVTITKTLSYAKAQEIEKIIRQSGMVSPRGRVIMDERTNSLIVTDVPTRIAPIDNLITSLDTETPQVMIEARIVETSRQFVQDFGVEWGFTGIADSSRGTQTNLQFPHNARVDYQLNLPFTRVGAISPNQLGVTFGNVLNSFALDLAIEALEVEGKARVLSAPKIATQNNEKAEIERGVRIPVVNTTATEINVEFVSASLRLLVTPQITAEGTIVLDIQVENNTPDFVNRVGDVPPINTQRAQTKVLINDGGTTVIGGIFSQSEGLSEAGVPWFRKVPLFGWLFKRKNVTNENRELLIFLTAKIMRSSA
ncbi:MAG: type IV pilus secretin PilQ [Acidobacteriota bacterium]